MVGRRRRAATSPLAAWSEAMRAGAAAAVTLSVRLPRPMTGTMMRDESARMVGETLAAATEGLSDASAAGFAPRRLLQEVLDVSTAAARPAQRRPTAMPGASRHRRPRADPAPRSEFVNVSNLCLDAL